MLHVWAHSELCESSDQTAGSMHLSFLTCKVELRQLPLVNVRVNERLWAAVVAETEGHGFQDSLDNLVRPCL